MEYNQLLDLFKENNEDSTDLFVKKELKALPNVMWDNEIPEKLVQGSYENRTGLLVATNQRLFFIHKGFISMKVEDFPYEKINSIQYKTGMMFGEITVFASGNKVEIKNILKELTTDFVKLVRNHINSDGTSTNQQSDVTENDNDRLIKQLKDLAELRNQGVLTEEEFQTQKNKILNN